MAYELVLIEWWDTHSGRGWNPLDEIEETCKPLLVKSVGWVICEENNCVLLVPHLAGEQNDGIKVLGHGDLVIPIRSIEKTTVLKEGGP